MNMKTRNNILSLFLLLGLFRLSAQVPAPAPVQAGPVVLKNGTVHVGNGRVIENAVVVFDKGKIVDVSANTGRNFDDSYTVYDVTGKHVYPGLILPTSQLGLTEIGSVRATVDARETGTFNPNVSSIVAYNTDSEMIPVLRSNGVLMAQIVPAGGLIPGTSSVVQLDAWNWEDAIVERDNAMNLQWPGKYGRSGRGMFSMTRTSSNYESQVKKIKTFFEDAASYNKLKDPKPQNLKLKAMSGLFDGSMKLFLSASDPAAIIESISFLNETGIKDVVLVGADEDTWLIRDFLKEHHVALLMGGFHRMPKRKDMDVRIQFKLPAMFYKEGFLVAFTFGSAMGAMNYPFVAGGATAYGLTKEEALQMVTLNAAKIIGVGDRAGSLENGKYANIVVSEGDLLDITTNNVVRAFINGREIDLDNRHKYLYRKFGSKYEE